MGEIVELFPNQNEKAVEDPSSLENKGESKVDLDMGKLLYFMGTLAALRKASPELFKKEKVDYEMGVVGDYSDFELIMKINNCTENTIINNPCLYLAINYEAWNRNLSDNREKEK